MLTMANGTPGIFCLEGDWSANISSRQSVEPLLELLQNCGAARYIHRDVATREELCHYVGRWLHLSRAAYPIGYLGFHGSPKTLHLSKKSSLTLDDLAGVLGKRAAGRILYFGSCATLATSDDKLKAFCAATKVKGIVGYTKWVDFITSAGFEIHLLTDLLQTTNFKAAHTRLSKQHPVLTKELGLRMAHSTWASDRSVAVAAMKASG